MIRIHLKRLIADYQTEHRQRLTLDRLSEATGIHKSTLSKIAGPVPYNTTTDNLDALCRFFGCGISDLVEFVEEKREEPAASSAATSGEAGRARNRSRARVKR